MNEIQTTSVVLDFRCSKCKRREFVPAERYEDGGHELPEDCPTLGWLRVTVEIVGLESTVEEHICDHCKATVAESLGYLSVKNMETVVKVNADMELSSVPAEDSQEIPFYLLDEEMN